MPRRTLLLLGLVLAVTAVAALAIGAVSVAPLDVWRALWGQGNAETVAIIRTLRVPRVLLGLVAGAGLGLSGGALQATLRNPLAEPYLLGVSGGAAVGAVLATALHLTSPALLPLAAFAGAAAAVVLVLLVAHAAGARGDPRVLVMAGVVIGAFANAVIMVVLADTPAETVRSALWWMMGSLGDATLARTGWIAVYVALGGGALLALHREIALLALGEEPAAALGVEVDRVTRRIYLVASLLAAVTVAGIGLVGFVGLIVPAIARALGARTVRAQLVAAALGGATLLVAADLAARTVRAPAELPLGAVTALVGVPFFLARLRSVR
jgi:iron complex transport system permease protein